MGTKSINHKSNTKCYEFKVHGMHCASCELTVERAIKKFEGVSKVDANLEDQTVKVYGYFNDDRAHVAQKLTRLLEEYGYSLESAGSIHHQKLNKFQNWKEYVLAGGIVAILMFLYLVLENAGLFRLDLATLNYTYYFVIGVIASLSSCAALIGGVLLSMSANEVKENVPISNLRLQQLVFHVSRLLSFFILGGVLGFVGSILPFEYIVTTILALLMSSLAHRFILRRIKKLKDWYSAALYFVMIGLFWFVSIGFFNLLAIGMNLPVSVIAQAIMMVLIAGFIGIMAMNLLDFFDITNYFQLKLPKSVTRVFLKSEEVNNLAGPALFGFFSFFFPCGYTLTVQGLALESKSFLEGAIMMFIFALGTLPVLAIISFSSLNLGRNNRYAGVFFKASGIFLIVLAVTNLVAAFRLLGIFL
ncbi:MAG: hypothetical protein KatS3mg084_0627 [Candidatus Dojkabacteria bacterium]|nr:MAG: hypothetical protein KatS3mg084_0627 [Candidatus Dojkabacteria bacterium]